VLLEEIPKTVFHLGLLLEQPLVDDIADVRRRQVDAEVRWKTVLELGEVVGLRLVLELLLACGEKPDASLEPLPQLGDERLELQHPALVLVDVLAHLVDHEEERLAGLAEI
jgi:hypothetical protein